MTITRTAIRLTDFTWIDRKRPRGPSLRFTITWAGTTEEDFTPALSAPGFRLIKNESGEIVLRVPTARIGSTTYHTVQISTDMANWIMEALKKTKMWKKVGQNYRPEKILDLPDELVPELPDNVELY